MSNFTWTQNRDFTHAEWGILTRHADRLVAQANAAQRPVLSVGQPGVIELYDRADHADSFALHQKVPAGDENVEGAAGRPAGADRWEGRHRCNTFGYPYADVVRSLLVFTGQVAPGAVSWSRTASNQENYRQGFRKALSYARESFTLNPAASPGMVADLAAERYGCDPQAASAAIDRARSEVVDQRFAPYLFERGPLTVSIDMTIRGGPEGIEDGHAEPESALAFSVADAIQAVKDYEDRHVNEGHRAYWEGCGVECYIGGTIIPLGDPQGDPLADVDAARGVRVLSGAFLQNLRLRVNEENPFVLPPDPQGPSFDPEGARSNCSLEAARELEQDPTLDLNDLVRLVAGRCELPPGSLAIARDGVEDAFRRAAGHSAILGEIWLAMSNSAEMRQSCMTRGNPSVPAMYVPANSSEPKRDLQVGRLLGRALGQWQVAFIEAERALTNDEDFFRVAAIAAESQKPEYSANLYRSIQEKRANAYELVGAYARWRDAALQFTATLAESTMHVPGRPFEDLDRLLRGRERRVWDTGRLRIAGAIKNLSDAARPVGIYTAGGGREVARDHYNLMEIAEVLQLAWPRTLTKTPEFDALHIQARGTVIGKMGSAVEHGLSYVSDLREPYIRKDGCIWALRSPEDRALVSAPLEERGDVFPEEWTLVDRAALARPEDYDEIQAALVAATEAARVRPGQPESFEVPWPSEQKEGASTAIGDAPVPPRRGRSR